MGGPRTALADSILRPHEKAPDPHRQYARRAALDELRDAVESIEVGGVVPATTTTPGIVRLAEPNEEAGGAVVQSNDPRLTARALSDEPAEPLGEAAAGIAGRPARADHVHPLPEHAQLPGRDAEDAHPIAAITGLRAELDAEEVARIAADEALGVAIADEEAARIVAVSGRQPFLGVGNRDVLTLSYDVGTRQVTLTGGAEIWIHGVKTTLASSYVFAAHPNTYGGHFFYFDENALPVVGSAPWDLRLHAPIAYIFYNPSILDAIPFYELHEAWRDPGMHYRLHFVDGTSVIGNPGTFLAGGFVLNSDADIDKTFGITAGEVMDEDIRFPCSAMIDGGPYTIFRRLGAAGEWVWSSANTFPFLDDGISIQYNEFTGATWQLTSLAGTQFVNMWVFATTSIVPAQQLFLVVGQRAYASQAEAEAESVATLDWGIIPFQEIAPLYQVTYRRANPTQNRGKVDIRRVARLAGSRNSIAVAGATPTVASAVTVVPVGGITQTNVQAALEGLDRRHLSVARRWMLT